MADRGIDRDGTKDVGTTKHTPAGGPTDVGRTRGGGSLGHTPADDELAETDLRNSPTGRRDDTVMPADDATLKTKI